MIEFWIDGIPKGQPRVRAYSRGQSARVYDPGTANDWKSLIALEAKKHRPDQPIQGPVEVSIRFYFPRPKRLMRKRDPEGHIFHTSKPDRDNCEKAVLDVLTNIGYWKDDSQVCSGSVEKYYHGKQDRPGATIQIKQIKEE